MGKRNCAVACIGCGKCEKACKFDAITITDFLAYIDFDKCRLCRKCVDECPTHAIWEVNFKPRKPKPAEAVRSQNGAAKIATPKPAAKPETVAEIRNAMSSNT